MSKEQSLLSFVKQNATQGNPESVLQLIDQFGWQHEWSTLEFLIKTEAKLCFNKFC